MFGIDLGINVSSVTLISGEGKVIDYTILFGDKDNKDDWSRICDMADAICDSVTEICKSLAGTIVEPLVSIEEPIMVYNRVRAKAYGNLCMLYALVKKRLVTRNFQIYSINPQSAKATAKYTAFGSKKLKEKYAVNGRLTKKGMVLAFTKVTGVAPNYSNAAGRETLADSFFIAKTGLDRRKVGVK